MLKTVAALLVLDVIAVYAYSLRVKGVYPPSHPWSGIALILLAGTVGFSHVATSNPLPQWVVAGGVLLSAGFWTFAAITRP